MDLRHYFRKIKEAEASLSEEYPVLVSLETADGGKAGRVIEVSRSVAAKMIVEGRAAVANDDQKAAHFAAEETAKLAAHRAEVARRVQVAIVTENDLAGNTAMKKK